LRHVCACHGHPGRLPASYALPSVTGAVALSGALVASGVSRRFGGRTVVRELSLALHEGDCLALFGPNGAGKTTLLRLLGGLLSPHAGSVALHGHVLPGEAATRRLLGVISHKSMLYDALTVRENLTFAAECQGVRDVRAAVDAVLDRLLVRDREDQPVRALSRGLQQRVSIARALVHGPRLVLLDEPYTGLDEVGARALTEALRALKAGGATVVLITHHLAEGLALATHAAIMREGRFVHESERPAHGYDVAAYAALYRQLVAAGE
jgi:heme exporter protein A